MTVREMIEALQAMPQDLEVYRQDYEWGADAATPEITEVERLLGATGTWDQYIGSPYRPKEPDTYEYKTVVLLV